MATRFVRRPLEEWESQALLDAAQLYGERLVVTVLLDTGLRISEFVHLRRIDLYVDDHLAVVRSAKSERDRAVPLTDRSMSLLLQWFSNRSTVGGGIRTWQERVKLLGRRAGIVRPVTPHTLRHTFATQSLRRGVDIRSLQLVLGHRSLRMTELYLNFIEGQQVRAFRELGQSV